MQTTQNDTNTIEIYSKDLSKITELKNGNIEKTYRLYKII